MSVPTSTTTKTGKGEAITAAGIQFNAMSGPGSGGHVSRILALHKKRQAQIEEFERQKKRIEETTKIDSTFGERFVSQKDDGEDRLRQNTVGLLSHDQFLSIQQNIELAEAQKLLEQTEGIEKMRAEKKKQKLSLPSQKLSFITEEDEDEEENEEDELEGEKNDKKTDGSESKPVVFRVSCKDPTADTDFLPDRERELKIAAEVARLSAEFEEKTAKEKNELIDVIYSLWDGSGHRRTITIKKGATIGEFLTEVLKVEHQTKNLKFAKTWSTSDVLFVKEDVILPHHITFYDLIASKARGKSGPLWNWDVHEDIRLMADTRIEKDESHAAKVVDRRWYEQNKHLFPTNRWELFNPEKKYETYTIHDKLKEKREKEKAELEKLEEEKRKLRAIGKASASSLDTITNQAANENHLGLLEPLYSFYSTKASLTMHFMIAFFGAGLLLAMFFSLQTISRVTTRAFFAECIGKATPQILFALICFRVASLIGAIQDLEGFDSTTSILTSLNRMGILKNDFLLITFNIVTFMLGLVAGVLSLCVSCCGKIEELVGLEWELGNDENEGEEMTSEQEMKKKRMIAIVKQERERAIEIYKQKMRKRKWLCIACVACVSIFVLMLLSTECLAVARAAHKQAEFIDSGSRDDAREGTFNAFEWTVAALHFAETIFISVSLIATSLCLTQYILNLPSVCGIQIYTREQQLSLYALKHPAAITSSSNSQIITHSAHVIAPRSSLHTSPSSASFSSVASASTRNSRTPTITSTSSSIAALQSLPSNLSLISASTPSHHIRRTSRGASTSTVQSFRPSFARSVNDDWMDNDLNGDSMDFSSLPVQSRAALPSRPIASPSSSLLLHKQFSSQYLQSSQQSSTALPSSSAQHRNSRHRHPKKPSIPKIVITF
ncbi:putative protein FAM50 [Monocercomonoides exilis]|uniref:putative protein FAM50 n=1 Tax=Monocercomonoides exilis TaxID=2049356 RepID=UPI0035596FD6|nr:putative protein FAM50 [Monocercomonoides exilis]|eukprot:MONOS_9334.1-p1 / transcript=MONOS_9334.1 / gene=MONOS_9334 / organism=Monocercomonoides_exilis_PA203 / gene_product=GK11956 / transcript_product=GK11956 / location=Mono_scaffold00382:2534-6146(+) / protein_length=894 / sequence_SO=supercontig / SO=protein_coding / is_pseudo=false